MLSTPMTAAEHKWWRKHNRYLNGYAWQRTRKAVIKRDGKRCVDCHKRESRHNPLQADHISYAAYNVSGQTSTPLADLQTRCRRCHEIKTGRKFKDYSNRRVHQLVGWAIILAAILAYAIIRG
jgi:5-methylcytosine-specific restriction endonuclease McrA